MPKPEIIEIAVPIDEIEARRERVARTKRFETPDRVPVIPAIAHRFLVPQVGVSFRDYMPIPKPCCAPRSWHRNG
jgi:hypothetical protein